MTLTPEVLDGPWVLCTGCSILVYSKRLVRNLLVCPECNQHKRVPAPQRAQQLVDDGSWVPLRARVHSGDPLEFTDSRPYPERLAEAQARTGLDDAVLCGTGRIDGHPVALAVMDFRFLGGSLGSGAGELVTRTAEVALDRRLPLLLVTASGGARIQEGVLALMQMAKVSQAIGRLQEAGLLSVSLVTDPTYGGVAASFATNTDIVIAESGARMGFAGPRVIEQTIGQRLPAGFQTADFLLQHGQVDMVVVRHALRGQLSRLLAVAGADRSAAPVHDDEPGDEPGDEPVRTTPADAGPAADAWDTVRLARHPDRPTTTDYLHRILDVFVELHGDRLRADCPAIVAGLGRIGGRPVAVIGHQKGHSTKELVQRNFGMARPEGYRKAKRIMQLAARLGVPVLTLIDTPGAYPGLDAEEHGQAQAIAQTILQMSALPVPVVAVLTGEGGSGGALALAVGDRVLAAENAVYSVISPEGCSSILWNTPTSAAEAARALRLTAPELLRMEIVDGVVPEPAGGAHADPAGMADRVRRAVLATLPELVALPADVLVERRRERFRRFGAGMSRAAGTGPDGGAAR